MYAIALLAFFLGTFEIDHPYNTEPWAQWFLSNQILSFFGKDALHKALFFLPILYAICSLIVTPLYDKRYNLIYPFSILFLLPHWLVDPRYHLIPLVLFLLFKRDDPSPINYLTMLAYVALSGWLL